MCPQSGTLPFGEDLNFKNIDSSTLPKLMDRQETPESSPRSHFSRQCTLDSTLETTEPSPFSRQCTLDSCFAVQVDVLVSVPESASRMAFETYIQRAGLEEDAVVALDEKAIDKMVAFWVKTLSHCWLMDGSSPKYGIDNRF
ncbi:unnamed protein product [Cladocopium goreaui]|uniref:Uncharacterized protein n=1 Tax=Cladocopium goreaui TaxID=2562237 RepID=A0A9P1BY57_9DINO|nr:unnamed protein product [Cladocopium goreaui]